MAAPCGGEEALLEIRVLLGGVALLVQADNEPRSPAE